MSASEQLLTWYEQNRRDLPWRRTDDPWAIWVSEVLLQQTRVESAAPYFERFLERFPTPAALAAAGEEEVLALWSGLGYYGRARRLRAAAIRVAAAGGVVPRTAAALTELPGIGEYTAAAIASIAFGEVVPVVDGNVARVVCRLLALTDEPARAPVRRRIAAAAASLLDPRRPGDSNQALMELGATVCTPRRPDCDRCPLVAGCRAAAAGEPEAYPRARPRSAPRRERWTAVVSTDGEGRVLLCRRPADEPLLAALWELPTVRARGRLRIAAALSGRFGGQWRVGERQLALRHAITTRSLEIELRTASWAPEEVREPSARELAWRSPAAARELALTGATRKLLVAWAAAN